MNFYAESINDAEKEKIIQWVTLATITYNIGLIESCEVVVLQDILDSGSNILLSGQENKVNISKDIIDFISNGDSPLVLIHNHSGQETSFSNRDIEAFIDCTRIKYIIVINSKKEIFILGKTEQTKSRDDIMNIYWDWWSDSIKKAIHVRYETAKILIHSPLAIHATSEEYKNLIKIEDEVISALHNMTQHEEFLLFARNAGFSGAYLNNVEASDKI